MEHRTVAPTDAITGGGTFHSILSRSIRRPSPFDPVATNTANLNNTTNDDDLDNSQLDASSSYNDSNNFNWTVHHANYQLLSLTLDYFRERRSIVRSKLYDVTSTTSSNTAVRCTTKGKMGMSLDCYNGIIGGCSQNAPFDTKDVSTFHTSATTLNANTTIDATNIDANTRSEETTSDHPYQNMDTSILTESEIIKKLSHLERTELSSLLDAEVNKAAAFYRCRVAVLSPPRSSSDGVDGYSACVGEGYYCSVLPSCGDRIEAVE
jgi:hypothetical protein